MILKKNILLGVKASWLQILDNNDLDKIIIELNKLDDSKIFPFQENIFETFKYFELKETKLVLLGQDPYHNIKNSKYPQANGLAFSVNDNYSIPPSLKNIYKELKIEYPNFKIPNHGNLIRWVKEENILLLNTSLSVEIHKPNSHMKIWQNYTNNIIKFISENVNNVIFLLFGNYAKKKIKYINISKINKSLKIINSIHPSPLSAHKGFFNSNIFIECNNYISLINSYKKLYFNLPFNDKKLNIFIIKKICKFLKNKKINWYIK